MIFWLFITAIIGLLIGSFINVVRLRLPIIMEQQWQQHCHLLYPQHIAPPSPQPFNLCTPRSHCPHCHKTLPWYALLPLLSYLYYRGRCLHCHSKISFSYFFIEFITMILSMWTVFWFTTQPFTISLPLMIAVLLFTWLLITLAAIDAKTQLLPDLLTFSLLWLGLLCNSQYLFTSPSNAIIGAGMGYGILYLVRQSFYWLRKREGLGLGDCKLLAALAAWLGWTIIPWILIIACGSGIIYYLLRGYWQPDQWHKPLPFGPHLAAAGWLALMAQPWINNWQIA